VCVCVCVRERERDQVSHSYKTTGKIMVSYILIFKFLENRVEGKRPWTEWKQDFPEFNLFLISSWMKFWFLTHSKDLLSFCKLLSYSRAETKPYIFSFSLSFLDQPPS
jgi:hypothetical protein